MTRTQKFILNASAAALYQIVVMLCGFILPRIMLVNYGSEINGLVSSIGQFVSYFNLVEAGLAGAAVYALYKPIAHKDTDSINCIVTATKKFYMQAGWIFFALVSLLAVCYPLFVKATSLTPLMIAVLIFAIGSSGFLEFFTLAKYRALLTADQRLYIISVVSAGCIILRTSIVYVLARNGYGIVDVYLVSIIAILARTLFLVSYVNRHYPYLNYNANPNPKVLDKRWDAFYLQCLGATQSGAPIIIATLFVPLKDISVYSVFSIVIGGINGVLRIFTTGLSSGFGEIIATENSGTLRKAIGDFEFTFYVILTVIYSSAVLLLMPFIRVYTNGIADANYDFPLLGMLMILNGCLYDLKTPQGMMIISAGLYKETRVQATIQALIVVVFGLILVRPYGIIGIVISSCLANLYRCIDLLFYVPRHLTRLPVMNTVVKLFFCFISTSAIYVFGTTIFTVVEHPASMGLWCVEAVKITSLSLFVTILSVAFFLRSNFMSVYARLRGVLK